METNDTQTRLATLQKIVRKEKLIAPIGVLRYLTTRFTNIREATGALIRISAYNYLMNQRVTLESAKFVLKQKQSRLRLPLSGKQKHELRPVLEQRLKEPRRPGVPFFNVRIKRSA